MSILDPDIRYPKDFSGVTQYLQTNSTAFPLRLPQVIIHTIRWCRRNPCSLKCLFLKNPRTNEPSCIMNSRSSGNNFHGHLNGETRAGLPTIRLC